MFDHEGCEFRAVDQDDARVDTVGVVSGVGAEARGGDEDSTACLRAVQGTDEGLDAGPPDVAVGVSLGLDVDDIQSKRIQADEPVQVRIARGT
jgi:hypothetical protein